jgi:hypothetical protein
MSTFLRDKGGGEAYSSSRMDALCGGGGGLILSPATLFGRATPPHSKIKIFIL